LAGARPSQTWRGAPCRLARQSTWQSVLKLAQQSAPAGGEVVHVLILVRRERRRGRARRCGRCLRTLGSRGGVLGVKVGEEIHGEVVAGRVWRRLRALASVKPARRVRPEMRRARTLVGSCARRAALHSAPAQRAVAASQLELGARPSRPRGGGARRLRAEGTVLPPEQQALAGMAGARLQRGQRDVQVRPKQRCRVL